MDPHVADILIEALPYIRQFYGTTVVIKYGGHAMVDDELKKSFALDITLMKYIGMNPVIVHGGGKHISEILEQMGKKPSFIDGLRVTDKETMKVTQMVLAGLKIHNLCLCPEIVLIGIILTLPWEPL